MCLMVRAIESKERTGDGGLVLRKSYLAVRDSFCFSSQDHSLFFSIGFLPQVSDLEYLGCL